MHRGEIRWHRFKAPDKKRPVLILTREEVIPHLNELTVAPVTSTIRNIPTHVMLDQRHGMPTQCAIAMDRLQSVPKKSLGALITTLGDAKLIETRRALLLALGYE
ncbi:MAG: type II toxin-antitoxin system PemK/MazF family toxin [Burkholderiales bacterium]|nr:type II toxin-antitoxin system PemK/MazF family toxin [Phycisphaerae bacterium]